MTPDFYEVVVRDYEEYSRIGFFKTLDECVMANFDNSMGGIANGLIIVYQMVDGLPKIVNSIEMVFTEYDDDLELNIEWFDYYTFDDGVVTLVDYSKPF